MRAMSPASNVEVIPEPGKRADIIIVEGNPLENIRNIRNVRFVITDGAMYPTAPLWQSVGFKP